MNVVQVGPGKFGKRQIEAVARARVGDKLETEAAVAGMLAGARDERGSARVPTTWDVLRRTQALADVFRFKFEDAPHAQHP